MKKTISNKQIVSWNKAHNIHPYMDYESSRLMIKKGIGAYVYDQDDKKYLDGIGGLWCVNIGHGRQEIAKAMQKQAADLAYFSSFVIFGNHPSSILAKRLAELAPDNLNHVYFTAGGSESNDAVYRVITNYFHLLKRPEKRLIISRHQAYHGMTFLTASISGIHSNNQNYQTVDNLIHYVSTPNCYRKPKEGMSDEQYVDYLADEFEAKISQLGAKNVAAFFAEPIMGAGGIYVAPKGYHRRMWEICEKQDIFYVSDEVVTAFCRLGEFFTSQSIYGIKPDFITIAKGITSGYAPLGGLLISDKVFDVIKKGSFTSAFTYSSHPVCTAAALCNIDLMQKEELGLHVKEISTYMWEKLYELKDSCKYLGDVRGSHFMIGLEFVKEKQTKQPFLDKVKFGNILADFALKNGLIIRPLMGNINVVSPTLIWQKKQVDEFIEILEKSIDQTVKKISQNNHL